VSDFNPLTESPPKEIPLENAPLVRVIAQVRFPPILSIEKQDFVGAFQEAIRGIYPVLLPEQTQGFAFGSQGIVQIPPQITWRFMDKTDVWSWRVSLASNFVALETTNYLSRSDFLTRLENILVALEENGIKPLSVERFGLRYIDRIIEPNLEDLSSLVKPEVSGMMSASFSDKIHQTISESLFNLPDRSEQIAARWGLIPANGTFDPSAIDPIEKPSWILDLDMSLEENRDFNVETLIKEGQYYAERLYTFFRWAVKDDFLIRFGGNL